MGEERATRWSRKTNSTDYGDELRTLLNGGVREPIRSQRAQWEDIDLGPLDTDDSGIEIEHLKLCGRCRGFFIDTLYRHDYRDVVTAGIMISEPRARRTRHPIPVQRLRWVSFAMPETEQERWDLWFESKGAHRRCDCNGHDDREATRRELDEMLRHIVERARNRKEDQR